MWENDFPHLHRISQLHWALDIKYKFDQHNDTSFQYLWPIGSPEPLTGQCPSQWLYFQGQNIIYLLSRPYFGTSCISVSPKTGIFWFHCQWFWTPYGSQILEICVIMLVEFVYYGYCSKGPWDANIDMIISVQDKNSTNSSKTNPLLKAKMP